MSIGIAGSVRWLKHLARRVAGRRTAKGYQPDFSGADLMHDLGQKDVPGAVHAARSLFEKRFFVSPKSIPSLWKRIEDEYPEWHRSLLCRTAADAEVGLPIYSMTGPVLGEDLPWGDLPLGPGNDRLYAKHLHRFAFTPRNGLACLYDPDAAKRLHGTLQAWICCATQGQNRLCYDSNLGVIQRILALSWCWAFLASRIANQGGDDFDLEWCVLRILHADIRFLEPRLGDSKANNHLLADRFAAWYLHAIFPEFLRNPVPECEKLWCRELLSQTYPDGGSFEHSMHYHEFACEMGAAYLLLSKRAGLEADPETVTRIEALLKFQSAIAGPGSIPLRLGNGIEDTLFPLDPGAGWCPGSIRELYRALFDPDIQPAASSDTSRVRAYWLLAGQLVSDDGQDTEDCHLQAFPHAGFYLMDDPVTKGRLIFRTGPASGEALCAGHMHADFLSVYLTFHGGPVIVDSGTYTYRSAARGWPEGSPDWRSYFSGPRAHNGIVLGDNEPLEKLAGDFRKSELRVRIESRHAENSRMSIVEAWYREGGVYNDVLRSCVHVFGHFWLIIDCILKHAHMNQEVVLRFQLAPGMKVSRLDEHTTLVIRDGKTSIDSVACNTLGAPEIIEGSIQPPGGWVSEAYGDVRPAPQLCYTKKPGTTVTAILVSENKNGKARYVVRVDEMEGDQGIVHVSCDGDEVIKVKLSGNQGIRSLSLFGKVQETTPELG